MSRLILIFFGSFFLLLPLYSASQTSKHTEKLQGWYEEEKYDKIIKFKKRKEEKLASFDLYLKGLAHFFQGSERASIQYFEMAIDKGPTTPEMYFFEGLAYLYTNRANKAIGPLGTAVRRQPTNPQFLSNLALAYEYDEQLDSAEHWYYEAIKYDPENGYLYMRKGAVHSEMEDFEEAIDNFRKAYSLIEDDKSKEDAHFNLGLSQYLAEQYKAAKQTFKKHIEDYPQDYHALAKLIQVHYAMDEISEAQKLKVTLNEARNGYSYPAHMQKMFCIDQFEHLNKEVMVYEGYEDQAQQLYDWRHKFYITDDDTELYTIVTQRDTAKDGLVYDLCRIQNDTLFKYGSVNYTDSLDYLSLRRDVKLIMQNEMPVVEVNADYKTWIDALKDARFGGDGMSFESAIVVNSVPEEYQYLRNRYPGYKFIMQSLINHEGKYYDVLKIKTAEGEELEIHFDISSFFGKGF